MYLKSHLVCGMGKFFFLRLSAEKMKRVFVSVALAAQSKNPEVLILTL